MSKLPISRDEFFRIVADTLKSYISKGYKVPPIHPDPLSMTMYPCWNELAEALGLVPECQHPPEKVRLCPIGASARWIAADAVPDEIGKTIILRCVCGAIVKPSSFTVCET